ncbi:acyl-CoA dehydrogenase [Spongiibacter sp. KMU-166]|uniref:Acyl-CoA dehydrogenase n=1 Tax=Spongiibacter thalassae TaxID=2721624 RepID=A0ABX1G9Y6_9GAMM|nr:acyl-CoA dehydrogenase family protein [Spongiibacter thalassae]NKI15970.1 acyl-CoA dehydrogenase [Spongiibacter thalassae]
MDLKYSAEYEAFREEVKAFLENNWPLKGEEAKLRRHQQQALFRQRAVEVGYLYRSVPRQFGGSEQPADVLKGQIIREEFGRVRAPVELPGVGTAMLVPTLLQCGSDWQKEYFIPKTLSGEYLWAQGYSEPNAGSDLASVKTRAELKDGKWLINGQKIWSTLAQYARFMFVMVRSEPNAEPRHAGLSYILVDLKQPGVTIRPLKQITGGEEFCEVFFDNAETPEDWIVGKPGEGWAVSKATLSHERSALGGASGSVSLFEKLVALAKSVEINGEPAIVDPTIRRRLAVLDGYVSSHLYSSYRQLSMSVNQQDPGLVTSMNKLISTNIGHDVARLARDLIGDDLMLSPPQDRKKEDGNEKWINQFIGSLGIAIAGGTSNIQRNVIAERGLGLPRE